VRCALAKKTIMILCVSLILALVLDYFLVIIEFDIRKLFINIEKTMVLNFSPGGTQK